MATIREVIQRACDLRPNAFSEEQLVRWLALLDGQLAGDVFLMSIEDMRDLEYTWEKDAESEVLVSFPHDNIYDHWLCAQIDLANGEYDRYNNDMTVFNACLDEFTAWFARTYHPAQGYMREEFA